MIWIWDATDFTSRADLALHEALKSQAGKSEDSPPFLSRSQIQRLISEGRVTLENKPIRSHQTFKQGDQIRIDFPLKKIAAIIPEAISFPVLFEDEHLLVINKPPKLTVHPSPTQMEHTLVHALLHYTKTLSQVGGPLRPGIVHRIDQDTSGVLVIAKTDEAHHRLTEAFSAHTLERTYWALSYGAPDRSLPKTIQSFMGRDPHHRKKMSMNVKSGKRAVTHFKILKEYRLREQKPFASWLSLTLETGRTHQIRVHLSGMGNSVLGDPLYGKPTSQHPKWKNLPAEIKEAVLLLPGQALHARSLGIKHPITHAPLYFEAEPYPEFQNLLDALNKILE